MSTYNYGWWFWVLAVQHYILTLMSTLVLLSARRRVTRAFRAPMMAVVIAVAISWVGNFLYIFKLGPWPGLNYLTMSLGLSGAVLAWAVVSEGLLDLLPRAREALIQTIADGVIILDRADRVIYANTAAQDHLRHVGRCDARAGCGPPARAQSLVGAVARRDGGAERQRHAMDRRARRSGQRSLGRRGRPPGRDARHHRPQGPRSGTRAPDRRAEDARSSEVRTLEELLPICASCKKVRDDKGYWSQIDVYLRTRAAVEFTHGICPDCDARLYGQLKEQPE